jgi:hypothetical protein
MNTMMMKIIGSIILNVVRLVVYCLVVALAVFVVLTYVFAVNMLFSVIVFFESGLLLIYGFYREISVSIYISKVKLYVFKGGDWDEKKYKERLPEVYSLFTAGLILFALSYLLYIFFLI